MFVRRHGEVETFARERGLAYLFTTADDYFRGEVPDAERERLLRSVAQRCAPRRVYASPLVAVYDFTSNAIATTNTSTAAGIKAATADF